MRMVRHHHQSQLLRQQKAKQGNPLLVATQREQSGLRYCLRYCNDGSAIRTYSLGQYAPQQLQCQ